jgi:hypothetical protein
MLKKQSRSSLRTSNSIPRRKTMTLVRTTLLGAAGVILALGLTAAQAQDYGGGEGGPPAAAPDKSGGGPAAGASEGGAPTGEAPKATETKPADKPGKAAGQTDKMGGEEAGKAAKDEKASAGMKDEKAGAEMKDEKAGTAAETKDTKDKAATTEKGEATTEGKAGATADTKAGAEGADGKTAKVDPQQISKAKTYFSQNRPRVKAIDRSEISVSIGIALPATIVLYDLPPDVIVVRGGCGIKYFLWGDDVVLVDSCTRRVVDIVALG